jgi:hypothetical protein
MKIIADTNIWYYISEDKVLFEKVKEFPIAPTWVSIHELNTSKNILDKEELVRNACRMQFHFKPFVIYEPPLIHLANLGGYTGYDYNEIESVLKFSSLFAQGVSIKSEEKEMFRAFLDSLDKDLQTAADISNAEADRIEAKIEDAKKHREKDTINLTYQFLDLLVKKTTNDKANLSKLDFRKVDLMSRVLDWYFKTLETTKMKMQPNDWFDFSIMAYVQPNDKLWTCDKRWIRMIKEAKCEEYLFTP